MQASAQTSAVSPLSTHLTAGLQSNQSTTGVQTAPCQLGLLSTHPIIVLDQWPSYGPLQLAAQPSVNCVASVYRASG
eukprot:363994-Chlamydomonas_euryale.AAC.4